MTDTFTSGKSLGHDFTSGTWQSDADQHWRKCSRCEVTDAKEAHSGGTATCTEKAFCTVCNQPYGELNASNHTGGTEVRGRVEATTSATGYTGDTYCKGCNAKIADGTTIPKKESSSGGGGTTYYRLTFDSNGGSSIQTIRTTYGKTINLSGYIPTRDGYNFIGWYSDKALTQKITEIKLNGSKTVYAGWTKSNPNTGINPFTDVNASDWFYDDVMFVYEKGLMSGISATTFAPYANATRNQIAVIFYRMEGSPAVEGKNSFTDVAYGPGTAWFYDAVTWAQQKGIMGGFGGGKFGPDEQVTREQLASIFYRYAQVKGYDVTNIGSLDSFTDRENVSDWAQEAMKWAVSSGIINGGENNLLDPKGTATRAEIAAMLHRFIEKQELRPVVTPSGTTGWTKPTGGGTSAKSPQTGDSFHTGLWLFTLCASAGAMAVTLIIKRREEEESRQLA